MTIPISYASLQTAIGEVRENATAEFVAMIPTFIALAEAQLDRVLPVRVAEVDAVLTATNGSRLVALPSDFREPVALWLTTYSRRDPLQAFVNGTAGVGTTSGTPGGWSINGADIELDVPSSGAHTFVLRYRKKYFNLATTDPNWLLTNHPDVYLWASLVEAVSSFEHDDAALLRYATRMEAAISQVKWQEGRSRSLGTLGVDAALLSSHGAGNWDLTVA